MSKRIIKRSILSLLISFALLVGACSGGGEGKKGSSSTEKKKEAEQEKADSSGSDQETSLTATEDVVKEPFNTIQELKLIDSTTNKSTPPNNLDSMPKINRFEPYWEEAKAQFKIEKHDFVDTSSGQITIRPDTGEELTFPKKKLLDKKKNKYKDNEVASYLKTADRLVIKRRHYIKNTDAISTRYHFFSTKTGSSFKCKGVPVPSPDSTYWLFSFPNITMGMDREYSGGFHIIKANGDSAYLKAQFYSSDENEWGINDRAWLNDSTFRLDIRKGDLDALSQKLTFELSNEQGKLIQDNEEIPNK